MRVLKRNRFPSPLARVLVLVGVVGPAAIGLVACRGMDGGLDEAEEDSDAISAGGVGDCPIATHWSSACNCVVFEASDQIGVGNPTPYPSSNFYYNYNFLPNTDRYVGDVYSTTAVGCAQSGAFAEVVQAETGVPVVHRNPGAWSRGEVLQAPGYVQIVHGNVVDGSLATVFLPPNWRPSGQYPVLLNGFYDINQSTFEFHGGFIASVVARSGSGDGRPVMGVIWNGGGANASRTANPRAFAQFGSLIDALVGIGADRWQVVTFGGSRGGLTALSLASHPSLSNRVRVVGAAAASPPTKLGELATFASTTYRLLYDAAPWSIGYRDAWRTGWRYPWGGQPDLFNLTAPEAALKILTGSSSSSEVDSERSLLSEAWLHRLTAEGTQVFLSMGSHDAICAYPHMVEYADQLARRGVRLRTEHLLGAGHFERVLANGLRTTEFWAEQVVSRLRFMPPGLVDVPQIIPRGSETYRVNPATGQLEFLLAPSPLVFEAPYVAARGQTFPLLVSGATGRPYTLEIRDSAGSLVWTEGGTIGQDVGRNTYRVHWITVPTGQPLGRYSYVVFAGGGGVPPIPSNSTPNGQPATLDIVESEPDVAGDEVANLAAAPAVDGFPMVGWGLSDLLSRP